MKEENRSGKRGAIVDRYQGNLKSARTNDYSNLKPRDPVTGAEIGDFAQDQAEMMGQFNQQNSRPAEAKNYANAKPISGNEDDEYTD